MADKYFIGTSGWQYDHWRNVLYPEKLGKKKWLSYYAERFNTVEVNSTFYNPIKPKTFSRWYNETPSNFKFTIKGYRVITHFKKLHDVEDDIKAFYERAAPLQHKLGCVLWQLPSNLHKNMELLEEFCKNLDKRKNNVIEFRHVSWFTEDVQSLLQKYKIGYCIISSPELPEIITVTSNILYMRFHGINNWYTEKYGKEKLKDYASKIKKTDAKKVYCYFNNDENGYAVHDAYNLRELLTQDY
ncbi:protein of unknown function DUF72 [Methanohalobium evestigatum Z-7303]|uniref:DUF72 domain-containing protein n=1 Tax=Methanohalobium evestigatum (strain ATCC BAA-1072 / DSM 3721 / NBRC 107634 / OCM 161 / Z-7303) TaxID=644295 RepID=D7E8A9_METEZ|nr:DUF72 domain-containing protein [Methanohalobium evestigatum]ADI73451.1 protein of unknown function DUF72 [Methanohalobium evestigatum Z-7303]